MNILPINKIIFASFAFVITNWKKIIEISILPFLLTLPLLSILPQMNDIITSVLQNEVTDIETIVLPDNFMVYGFLFLYGYISLSINMYKLVIFGQRNYLVFEIGKIFKFIGLILLVGIVTMLPLLLNIIWLHLIVYFLIIPITLNFVNIAIGQPFQAKWNLGFVVQLNLFFLQVLLPMLIAVLSGLIIASMGVAKLIIMAVVFYWSAVSLALCYKLIKT